MYSLIITITLVLTWVTCGSVASILDSYHDKSVHLDGRYPVYMRILNLLLGPFALLVVVSQLVINTTPVRKQ